MYKIVKSLCFSKCAGEKSISKLVSNEPHEYKKVRISEAIEGHFFHFQFPQPNRVKLLLVALQKDTRDWQPFDWARPMEYEWAISVVR